VDRRAALRDGLRRSRAEDDERRPHWSAIATPGLPNDIAFGSASHGMVLGTFGVIDKSLDGWASWRQLALPPGMTPWVTSSACTESMRARPAVHRGPGVAAVAGDGGQTSTPQVASALFHGQVLHFFDALHGCQADEGQVASTTDGGATWTRVALPHMLNQITAITASDAQHVWITGLAACDPSGILAPPCDTVLASTDGGATWTPELG
jgi:photosystem II stability/assembly factor-like uncharacterized protein